MLDILHDFLVSQATPEQLELVREAIDLFEAMNDQTYEQPYINYLMMDGQADAGVTLGAILDFTKTRLLDCLSAQGISINPDAKLSVLTKWLKATLTIMDYEDTEHLMSLATSDASHQDIVAELMAIQAGVPVEEMMLDLEGVDPNLLGLIVTVVAERRGGAYTSGISPDIIAERIAQYKAFTTFHQIGKLKLAFYLKRGLSPGYPLKLYLNMLSNEWESLEVLAVAQEMVCSAYLSCDAHDHPHPALRAELEHFISDPDKCTQVDLKIAELILTFSAHG